MELLQIEAGIQLRQVLSKLAWLLRIERVQRAES